MGYRNLKYRVARVDICFLLFVVLVRLWVRGWWLRQICTVYLSAQRISVVVTGVTWWRLLLSPGIISGFFGGGLWWRFVLPPPWWPLGGPLSPTHTTSPSSQWHGAQWDPPGPTVPIPATAHSALHTLPAADVGCEYLLPYPHVLVILFTYFLPHKPNDWTNQSRLQILIWFITVLLIMILFL